MGMVNILRNYYKSIRCSQLSKARILEIQEQCFRRLLRHTVKHSEFYQDLYRGIDIDNCGIQDLPIVTKSAMMDNFDRFVTDFRLKLSEIQEWIGYKKNYGKLFLDEFLPLQTSGTSGEYALVVYDRKAIARVQASLFARHPLHANRSVYYHIKMLANRLLGSKARIAIISIPRGNLLPMVMKVPSFHKLFAELKILSVFDPIEQNIASLNRFKPNCLMSNSFYLAILAHEQIAGKLNIAFNQPTSFLAGGAEAVTEHTKGLALNAWNCCVQEDYGATECYFMATSCQKSGRLHAMNDLCILEVVDGDYNPVPKGQYGEKTLLTNLFNFTQPIIRYEIDDIVGYADQSCECGIPFPVLLPIQGRTTDFLYFEKPRGGYERFTPYRLRTPLFYAHKLRQYQIVQTARNELVFFYVPQYNEDGIEQQLRQILEEALQQAGLKSRVTLKLKRVVTIPRDDCSGKFKVVKSLGVPSDLDTTLDTNTH